jgi:hypothetical protein
MKITEIRVDLTRQGPKQFESDRVGLTAFPEDGEDVVSIIKEMKRVILCEIESLHAGSSVIEEKVEVVKNKNVTKGEVTKPQEKPQQTKERGDVSEKDNKDSEKVRESSEEASGEEVGVKEASSEKASEEKVAKKGRKPETERKTKGTGKNTPYDRTLDTHKSLLGAFLDEQYGRGWRSGSQLKKAGAISAALHEEKIDFLDGDGNILESFKERFRSEMSA